MVQDCECALGSFLGLIKLNGDGLDVAFTKTLFENNNYAVPGIVSLLPAVDIILLFMPDHATFAAVERPNRLRSHY